MTDPQPTADITPEQAAALVSDLLISNVQGIPKGTGVPTILAGLAGPNSQAVHSLLLMAAAAGYAAGHASKAPADERVTLLANALRATHQEEMFGDCTEDGDHFPCRTIRAVNIVVGAPDDTPLITSDDFGAS